MKFKLIEIVQLMQVASLSKKTAALVDEWGRVEVEVEVDAEQAQELVRLINTVPISGTVDTVEKRLPVMLGIREKLSPAKEE